MHNNKGSESLLNPDFHCFDINLMKKWTATTFNINNRLPLKQVTISLCKGHTLGHIIITLGVFLAVEDVFMVIAGYLSIDNVLPFHYIISKGWRVQCRFRESRFAIVSND